MKVSLIQTNIFWADKKANLINIEKELETLTGKTDLVVLPEMFTTGFCIDQLELAEPMDGETVLTLIRWAKEYNLAITGSFIACENEKIYNRAFFVKPDGEIHTADKRHLFSMGGEDKFFSSGDKRLIINYNSFNICILVCYDVRFPVWSRNVNNEYDLLVYTASFPHARMDAWDALLRARAIENQAYVCGLNRVGVDGADISYSGHSVMLDFKGKEMTGFSEYEENVKTVEIHKEPLEKFREKYAFWKDADRFEIKQNRELI